MIYYEFNNLPIIRNSYLYNTFLLGYSESISEKMSERIYYFKSHGKKYIIVVEKSFKDKKILDVNIKLKEVESFEIPEGNSKIEYKYYGFEEKLSCILRIKKINEMDDLYKIRFLGKKEIPEKSKCIVSEHLFLALEPNIYNVYESLDVKPINFDSAYELAKNMFTMDELKEYIKSKK